MFESHNDSGSEDKITIGLLNEDSESMTDHLEKIEGELSGMSEGKNTVSREVRTTYYRLKSLSRGDEDNSVLNEAFSRILEKNKKLYKRTFSSKMEYDKATTMLLVDLSELETSTGEKLSDLEIDGGVWEAGIALKEGIVKALSTIYEELEGYYEMMGMEGDFLDIIEKIGDSISIETFLQIYYALVDMGGDTIRDFSIIMDNSSPMGKAIELSKFIPENGILLLFNQVGPGRFLKILNLGEFVPDNAMNALNVLKEKGKSIVGNQGEVLDVKLIEGVDEVTDAAGETVKETVINNVDTISDTTEYAYDTKTVRDNFGKTEVERRDAAQIQLAKNYGTLTEVQLKGIMDTHEIGKELFEKYLKENGLKSTSELSDKQIREIFNSSEGRVALRQKMKKLKKIGIEGDDATNLIRSGITGGISDDFAALLNGKFVPSQGPIKSSRDQGGVGELFGDSLNELSGIMKRVDGIKAESSLLKKDISGLFDGLESVGVEINDLYILSSKGALDVSKKLNQEYGVILSKYKELGLLKDELGHIDNKMKNFELSANAGDVVDKLIHKIDFDEGNFKIIKNNYETMHNHLQKKINKFTNTVGRKEIKLEVIDKSQTIFESLLKQQGDT